MKNYKKGIEELIILKAIAELSKIFRREQDEGSVLNSNMAGSGMLIWTLRPHI